MPSLSYSDLLQLLTTVRDERRLHANTATRVGTALIELLRYLNDAPYLRKDRADQTDYLLSLLAGAVIGQSGQIRLNPDGSITCGRIHVEGSAIFDELVFNRQRVNEGDQIFTDRGIIDTVEYLGNGRYRLGLRLEHEQRPTTFEEHDVLRSRVNRLDGSGEYYASWFRVQSVDRQQNLIDTVLYPDSEVPGGVNYAPVEGATVARWGNAEVENRQQSFYLSATDGLFCFLRGVTKPLIDQAGEGTQTAAYIGLPPDTPLTERLVAKGYLQRDETVLFAQKAIIQSLITVKQDGTPDYVLREWDAWDASQEYIRGWDSTEGRFVQDSVWHGSSLWKCVVPRATVGVAPSLANTDWICVRTAGLTLEVISTAGDFFRAGTDWQTTLVAELRHGELTLTLDDLTRLTWTRESGNQAADEAWNINQAKQPRSLQLHIQCSQDIPQPWRMGSEVGFRCTVDVKNGTTVTNSYNIQI